MQEDILSVGIDIGTSTTQIVFSRITIENLATDFAVPRVVIVNREIVYQSEVYRTPIINETTIDMKKIRDIMEQEYTEAGIEKNRIQTGAIVITGETARKENANEALLYLSEFAGDFVVATAGPNLESVIAGRGAGIDEFSKNHEGLCANFDVGGGTTNIALFRNGKLEGATCLDIGGRLVRVEEETNIVTYIAPKIQELLISEKIIMVVGEVITREVLDRLLDTMAQKLVMALGYTEKDGQYKKLLTVTDCVIDCPIENVSFSGGVADYIYGEKENSREFPFGDIGVLLGRKIREATAELPIYLVRPKETIRATVVGAGSYMTEISGSTIEFDEEVLPLKNIPIVKLTGNVPTLGIEIKEKSKWFGDEQECVAVALDGISNADYSYICQLAEAILEGTVEQRIACKPLVVILEKDMAKVLGQTLRSMLPKGYPIVCIDGVMVENGDYVDIGMPLGNRLVLPVIIKTLVFR